MGRMIRITLLILLGILIGLQFFQPNRNLGSLDSSQDFFQFREVPDSLVMIFQNSCYDCHSNRTKYPWYSYVVPVSWYMEKHVRNGKDKLNFSEWGGYTKKTKIGFFNDICEEVASGEMPLKSYLLIHRKEKLSSSTIAAICEWTESETTKILEE